MRCGSIALALALAGHVACAYGAAAQDEIRVRTPGDAYRSILQSSGLVVAADQVVTDEATWRAVWTQAIGSRRPAPAPPAVDFTRESVLVAAAGRRATGGVSIAVQMVRAAGNGLLAQVLITEPGRGCIRTQALSAPVDMLIVSRPQVAVRFVRETRVRDC
jgi:hypothetical protein